MPRRARAHQHEHGAARGRGGGAHPRHLRFRGGLGKAETRGRLERAGVEFIERGVREKDGST
jgi:hypothetical protein